MGAGNAKMTAELFKPQCEVGPPPTFGVKFASAGLAACVAESFTFPLDTAKVRLQIQGETAKLPVTTNPLIRSATLAPASSAVIPSPAASPSPALAIPVTAEKFKYRGMFRTIYVISHEEGVRALYNGFIAGLHRQVCFASVRIGCYDNVKGAYISFMNADPESTNVTLRILAAITTGAAAVCFAQPTDVVKVRMQAQLPNASGVRRYTGTFKAYHRIATEEGVRGLWKGILPNICRNAIVNASELVSYDLIKEWILRHNLLTDNMPCHFMSAFGAGFCTTVIASPVDVVKTRYMNSAPGVYRGAIHCAVTMYTREGGLKTFYKGFMPSFVRLGSWNICMFVSFEQIKRLIMRYC